jgi:hypothetical protein
VKEQSHKNEMSAAIRGDFQRLRDRGVAATLAPRDDEDVDTPVEIVPEHEEPAEIVTQSEEHEVVPEPEAAVSDVATTPEELAVPEDEEPAISVVAAALSEPEPEPQADEVDEPVDAERQGFLSRLFGR